ncbi:hypothetical protein CORC01_06958 [Colletotrichum orchidophilum]|uniref:Uncharacterized protein n=1 Tax=Colletotrichum orchidophilum TaxID=1209926 RepID=A0A1G4B8T3_9PEZI|nr:uncharacterized protein CORC01_06958 [Colletotrichum orchidophilum]OHE97753.1 hypothetical protein CORC01_06958 [Colletotrichum orchidophilum]
MKFTTLFTLTSALTNVTAAPNPAPVSETTPSSHPHQLFKGRECPSYYASKGSCHGTSCRWGLVNY